MMVVLTQASVDRRQQVQRGRLDVVADRGYFNSEEILACELG